MCLSITKISFRFFTIIKSVLDQIYLFNLNFLLVIYIKIHLCCLGRFFITFSTYFIYCFLGSSSTVLLMGPSTPGALSGLPTWVPSWGFSGPRQLGSPAPGPYGCGMDPYLSGSGRSLWRRPLWLWAWTALGGDGSHKMVFPHLVYQCSAIFHFILWGRGVYLSV